MRENSLTILIGGEAGQGLATIAGILCKALVRQGYHIVVTQDYMSRIRGGHNTFAIRISNQKIHAPEEKVDLLVALNEETVVNHGGRMTDQSLIISDEGLKINDKKRLKVPFNKLTEEKFQNVAALGVLGALLGLDRADLQNTVHSYFGKKSDDIVAKNDEALEKSYSWAGQDAGYPFLRLKKIEEPQKRLMLEGNQAIALGALSAGVKFYSFYPMTPATSIANNLAAHMDSLPIVVEQAEDEIAAINMAIGASYAGAPAMVGTSGGGFALMVEAVSLAGATETPLVIALVQRPGPATGLPTRTEQADLELALYAGHGEFPRAILAPGTVEQCFHLTRKAFELAEKTQGPVFILSDEFIADSWRAIEPFDVDALDPVKRGADPGDVAGPYERYKLTDSGVSPRLLPGASEHLVVADSHEHYQDGHPAEDAAVRREMVDKRLRKMSLIEEEAVPPEYVGDEKPDLLLVCWGSTRGAALEAADMVRDKGKSAAVLHFPQVWPIIPGQFAESLFDAGSVACVESNATGQFARLLALETGFEMKNKVLRYDGRAITPEFILKEIGW
jgi:2-oxoglutarate ferredoxin oxidoreductase subunit alpha